MKRWVAILVTTFILACPFTRDARAQFSEFARITPQTEERYNVYLQILPVEGQEDKYRIVPPKVDDAMCVYLIICKEPVSPGEQAFRSDVWSQGHTRASILSLSPLLPQGQYDSPEPSRYVVPPKPADVILDKSLLTRSYIYIDYPHEILDGGYYYCIDLSTYPLPESRRMGIRYSPAEGLGPEPGVARHGPSDIVKVGDLYYVWYCKGPAGQDSSSSIWYATSGDGRTWTEKGEALAPGSGDAWDGKSVSAPNILVVGYAFRPSGPIDVRTGKSISWPHTPISGSIYWLFYTGTPGPANEVDGKATKSAIGIAQAGGPDGPWQKLSTNPALRCDNDSRHFDSLWVDEPCALIREGKYWLYYRARGPQYRDPSPRNRLGIAIAEKPQGPYVKYVANPVVEGTDQVLVWPVGTGTVAVSQREGEEPSGTLQYAADGLEFSKMQDQPVVPRDAGAYRPEAFTDNGKGRTIRWGIHTGYEEGSPAFLERFDCEQTSGAKP